MYVVRKVKVLHSYSCCYGDDGNLENTSIEKE